MIAGQVWEHAILNAVDQDIRKDHQIIIEKYGLRVNLDGDKNGIIYEVKTHNFMKEFEVTSDYWKQVQVQLFAYKAKKAYIVAYGLVESEYYKACAIYDLPEDEKLAAIETLQADSTRINMFEIKHDKTFIQNEFLPSLKPLLKRMRKENAKRKESESNSDPEES